MNLLQTSFSSGTKAKCRELNKAQKALLATKIKEQLLYFAKPEKFLGWTQMILEGAHPTRWLRH
jgi:hypothetical protein